MNVVVDASVAVKWFSRSHDEVNMDAALLVLQEIRSGDMTMVEPPHFVAEVAAVLTRKSPSSAKESLADLMELEMEIVEERPVLARVMNKAVDLAIRFEQHVFDTLYHAVAVEYRDTRFVTADERYYRKAAAAGRIVRLAELSRL